MTYTLEVRDHAGNITGKFTYQSEEEAYAAMPDFEADGMTCTVWRNEW